MIKIRWLKGFPFLKGRIRTAKSSLRQYERLQFPFLIGRIRTDADHKLDLTVETEFPFLIGRIRTRRSRICILI